MTSRCDTPSSARRLLGGVLATLGLGFFVVLSSTPAVAQGADEAGDLGIGMEIFNASCSSCHLADGTGSSAGRSLIDVALEQPDRSVHVASVTNGVGGMPAFGDRLEANEIDAAVSYIRLTFRSEEDPLDELPNTGLNAWLFAMGFGLVAAGGAMTLGASTGSTTREVHVF